jgi:hypothetical protein
MSFFQTQKFFWCRLICNDINSLDSVCAQTLFWIQPERDPRANACGGGRKQTFNLYYWLSYWERPVYTIQIEDGICGLLIG